MATQGKIKTLYSDVKSEEALFPRTKTNAVSDQNGIGLDAILDKAVYTKSINDNELNAAPVNADTLNGNNSDYFASKSYVAVEIAKAQLDGEDVNIDLSGYATKDDLNAIDFPVDSVNGKTGEITLSASDVGAYRNLGNNVINNINNDTTANWVAVDSGYSFYTTNGLLNSQPSQWGILLHFKQDSDIFQIWRTQSGGPTYWRSGNGSGWSGTWAKAYDTSNKPTPADIGAAASSHNHAASNITSGTLGIARGGTGRASLTANSVLTGNGTSAVNQVATASGALYATAANGAAKFGKLPIGQGGTNATDAATACSNLGLSPAMNIGTIYETREKYKNKTVYAKAVSLDLGTGDGNKYVSVDANMTEVVSVDMHILNSYLDYLPQYVSLLSVFVNVDSGNLFVNNAKLSGYTAYAIVKYIK